MGIRTGDFLGPRLEKGGGTGHNERLGQTNSALFFFNFEISI